MTVPAALENLSGTWSGTNQLWIEPGKPASESETRATINAAAQGQFLTMKYTWVFEGQPQDGLIVIGQEAQPDQVKVFWIDSFHMGDKFMVCQGDLQPDGAVRVKGSYAAPPGPDWGWRISITATEIGTFQLTMHNITPEGEEFLAVKATYRQKG